MLQAIVKKRVQSPSSINTYKQCPRKYYYQYIEKLPSVPNIHQVRGNIVHSVLEHFFDLDQQRLAVENYRSEIQREVQQLLMKFWKESHLQLTGLQLNEDQKRFYFEETMLMLLNWSNQFIGDMEQTGLPVNEAFAFLTPVREQKYYSEKWQVQGYVDAIYQRNGETHLVDYKTSSSLTMSDEQRLQLGIYSFLYQQTHGQPPAKVGIFFLRQKLRLFPVDKELLEDAQREIIEIHKRTQTEHLDDYPRKTGPLCKWSTGQCDFFNVCKPFENGKS